MVVKSGSCPDCGSKFTGSKTGRRRIYCRGIACENQRKYRQRAIRRVSAPVCSTAWCDNKVDRVGAGLCERCYALKRRNGNTLQPTAPTYRYTTAVGYIRLYIPDHKLADKTGCVFEHRKVLYDKLMRSDLVCCEWCGGELGWSGVVVDHLNEIKDDNRPENLVAACSKCNRARGAFKGFLDGLQESKIGLWLETTEAYLKTAQGL